MTTPVSDPLINATLTPGETVLWWSAGGPPPLPPVFRWLVIGAVLFFSVLCLGLLLATDGAPETLLTVFIGSILGLALALGGLAVVQMTLRRKVKNRRYVITDRRVLILNDGAALREVTLATTPLAGWRVAAAPDGRGTVLFGMVAGADVPIGFKEVEDVDKVAALAAQIATRTTG